MTDTNADLVEQERTAITDERSNRNPAESATLDRLRLHSYQRTLTHYKAKCRA